MTQYTNVTIDPTVTNGSQLAANIGGWRKAELSMHSGVERPPYAVAGTMWISTASTPWQLNLFDGVQDVSIGTVSPDDHAFQVTGGTAFTNDLLTAANAGAARTMLGAQAALGYQPVNRAGDTINGSLNVNGGFATSGSVMHGGATYATDGNINGSVWSNWGNPWAFQAIDARIESRAAAYANSAVSNRAVAGAECQPNSGIYEFGYIDHNEDTTTDCPGNFVLTGARWESSSRMYLRARNLRNQ